MCGDERWMRGGERGFKSSSGSIGERDADEP